MKLRMYRGDSAIFNLEAKQFDGSPLDVSSGTLFFTAKTSSRQSDEDAVFQKDSHGNGITITNGASGLFSVYLSPSDTSDIYAPSYLVWDIQFVTTGGNVFTLMDGTMLVRADVTHSTAYL
jgi:hypothetical protein